LAEYVAIELEADQRLRAVAEEAALRDADLDEIERRLERADLEPERQAALALALGRAGRAGSGAVLARVKTRLVASGRQLEAEVVALAIDLLPVPPSPRVERAESGYRYQKEALELYVEDAIAAHWHQIGRWGPPIRPDPSVAPIAISASWSADEVVNAIEEGGTAIVTFSPRLFGRPEPPVRLVRAGMSRTPALSIAARWSRVRSVGVIDGARERRAAFEIAGEPRIVLPARSSIPTDELVSIIARLVERSRS
jgi:hypothetical protein